MQIIYQDEYGEGVYWGQNSHPASIGDTIIVDDEEYRVKSRIFYPQDDKIVITVTQGMIRSAQTESTDSGRLNEVKNAILAINKRQDASEKKGRALNEQIGSIRKHINQRIQQEKKDTQ